MGLGKGNMIWKNGRNYTGDWVDSKIQGKGVMVFENGDVYKGEFMDDN